MVLVALAHPLGQQCEATAKGTGRRCERRVIAGRVCYIHGGRAKQVRQKAEQRLALYDAQVAAGQEPVVVVRREPEELLFDALHDTNAVLQQLKVDLHGGSVNPILLDLAGQWLDRLGRLGKVITDGDLATKLHDRIGWRAQDRAQQLWGMLAAVLRAAPLTAQDRLLLWNSIPTAVQLIADEREPLRLSPQEVSWFTSELAAAAAEERAAAEGPSVWPDFPESDANDLDPDDVGVPSLFLVDGQVNGHGERAPL